MHHRLATVLSVVLAIAAALLASSAGLAVSFPREVYKAVTTFASSSERSVDRVRGRLPWRDGAARMALVRAKAGAMARLQTASGAGTAGPRTGIALGAAWADLTLVAPLASRRAVEVRRHGVPSPGQPGPSSRAPPVA